VGPALVLVILITGKHINPLDFVIAFDMNRLDLLILFDNSTFPVVGRNDSKVVVMMKGCRASLLCAFQKLRMMSCDRVRLR